MNRCRNTLAVAMLVGTVTGGVIGAQTDAFRRFTGGRTFPPGVGGSTALAGLEPIQTELKLDSTIKSNVNKILDQLAEESMKEYESSGVRFARGQLEFLKGEKLAEMRRDISERTAAIGKKLEERYRPRLKSALSPAQYRRFQQIVWQWDGSKALVDDPELIAALKITTEQKKAISDLNEDIRQRQSEIQRSVFEGAGANGPSREEMRDLVVKMQEIDKARDKKAAEMLSKKQQAEYAKLKGEPYDFSKFRPDESSDNAGGPSPSGGKKK
jgi:hypothetical protein